MLSDLCAIHASELEMTLQRFSCGQGGHIIRIAYNVLIRPAHAYSVGWTPNLPNRNLPGAIKGQLPYHQERCQVQRFRISWASCKCRYSKQCPLLTWHGKWQHTFKREARTTNQSGMPDCLVVLRLDSTLHQRWQSMTSHSGAQTTGSE